MTSFLLRDARLADLDGTGVPEHPVDVRVTDGRVTEVGPQLAADGVEEVATDGRWLLPGLWDQHVHLTQWALSSARLDLASARSAEQAVAMVEERLREWPDFAVVGWGHRPTDWPEDPVVSRLDAIDTYVPIVLIAGDGHHAWLNSTALLTLHLSLREGVVAESEWFAAYGRLATILGDDGTGPGGDPAHPAERRRARRRRRHRPGVLRRAAGVDEPVGGRRGPAAHPRRDVRRRPRRRDRRRAANR